MPLTIRRYLWVVHLLTIASCAFFAAQAAGHLLGAGLAPSSQATIVGAPPPPSPHAARESKTLVARNVFCSTCAPAAAETATERASDLGEPTRCTLDVRLIATLVGEDDPAWSFAAILDVGSGQTRLYPIGSRLAGRLLVSDVTERRVWLLNDGRVEYLDIAEPAGDPARQPQPPPGPGVGSDPSSAVRRLGEGKYEIERAALQRVLSNTMALASTVRIIPAMTDGQPSGFTVDRIRPGSVVSLIGLRNGDTVHAVNGHSIKSPDDALLVFAQLRRAASHLTISFSRQGKAITHDYTIR